VDLALDALAVLLTDGYATAAPALSQALELLLDLTADSSEGRRWRFLANGRAAMTIAMERCDCEALYALTASQTQVAREMGALVQLRTATMGLAAAHILRGDLAVAARLIEEEHLIAEATGIPPVAATAIGRLAGPGTRGVRADRDHRPGRNAPRTRQFDRAR
jgi:hypothetical protein